MTTDLPETKRLAFGEKTLAYFELGSGPALVIVHGVGGHKEDWLSAARRLASTHRVFAIDMLGFGASSKTGDDLSMPVQSAAIKALLDAEQVDRAALVGNSVGGWVATTFAATYPERTERLVIIDAAGFRAMFEGEPPVNFDPNSPEEMDKLIHVVINSKVADTPGLAESAYRAYVESGEKAISAIWGRSLFVSPRLEDLFPKVTVPTVILWGQDDRLFPAVLADAFRAQLRGSRVEMIADAGHFPQIDQPDATAEAIARALV
ncbi:putative enzyme with alpha/beta-hydrolase domain; putative triacylglycerol lipase (esterase) [Bradyrhizobium sp. ORS 278]|uniref:alpha/beta fold hydrolase n=1 Tax=Bradyrhizobium sp. (strain ORS 278) TaxID=114615 RepID=UPI000150837D|nr:alpha/beta hydrolase [Bradyrhizobium sp. ORS 278]CAL78152.1 putative enzyme with alpha/beta-hydrolase domain; putative triacylglycerol lipase (esterase) [Bradyrhizobium sp. ORS 278]